MGTYFHSLLGTYSLNSRLSGYLIFRDAGDCPPGVFRQWWRYRSHVVYVRFFNRSRVILLQIIVNSLVILWMLSIRRRPFPGPQYLLEWWDCGASCLSMQSPESCFTVGWLVTLRYCAVVLTTEPHVRPSHSLVVHLHGGERFKTFIRWPSGDKRLAYRLFDNASWLVAHTF